MDFKVFFSNVKIASDKLEVPKDKYVQQYKLIKSYHCYKLLMPYQTTQKGVEEKGSEIVNSDKFFKDHDAKGLVYIGFIFVNYENGVIFNYKCSKKIMEILLNNHLGINNFRAKVDANKLKEISKIKLTLENTQQLSFFSNNLIPHGGTLCEALNILDTSISKYKLEFALKNGTIFNVSDKKLEKILSEYDGLLIEGLDESENLVQISKIIQLTVKNHNDYSTFDELDKLSLDEIVEDVILLERDKMNGYATGSKINC